jgi:hypothetical protein
VEVRFIPCFSSGRHRRFTLKNDGLRRGSDR